MHRFENNKMHFIFLPVKGRLCAFAHGWEAHISLPALSDRRQSEYVVPAAV